MRNHAKITSGTGPGEYALANALTDLMVDLEIGCEGGKEIGLAA